MNQNDNHSIDSGMTCLCCVFQAPLNDSHSMLIVHWAGEESSVIIALAKSSSHATEHSSKVYLSNDYGQTFTDITDRIRGSMHPAATIDKYYNSDVVNSHVSWLALVVLLSHLQILQDPKTQI